MLKDYIGKVITAWIAGNKSKVTLKGKLTYHDNEYTLECRSDYATFKLSQVTMVFSNDILLGIVVDTGLRGPVTP